MNGADLLVKCLEKEEVDVVFGYHYRIWNDTYCCMWKKGESATNSFSRSRR